MATVQGPQRYRFGPFELDIARQWSRGPVEAGIRRAHWRALFAADFFTTDVWTVRGLVTYTTFFAIELHSRRVHVLGSTSHPDEAFVVQAMRALTNDVDGFSAESHADL